jgi:hypothetical protein
MKVIKGIIIWIPFGIFWLTIGVFARAYYLQTQFWLQIADKVQYIVFFLIVAASFYFFFIALPTTIRFQEKR